MLLVQVVDGRVVQVVVTGYDYIIAGLANCLANNCLIRKDNSGLNIVTYVAVVGAIIIAILRWRHVIGCSCAGIVIVVVHVTILWVVRQVCVVVGEVSIVWITITGLPIVLTFFFGLFVVDVLNSLKVHGAARQLWDHFDRWL